MGEDEDRPPVGVDITRPSPARVWDYFLGGKDNYAVDRAAAEMIISLAPDIRSAARAHRTFLERAVRHLAQAGIRQFIDLGAGIPTSPSTHQIAREVDKAARVVYVDFDPLVVVHGQALLATHDGVSAVRGDIRRPDEILDNPQLNAVIDFAEPVGVLFIAVLPFVTDAEDPYGVVARFRERMAPRSYAVIAHAASDSDPAAMAQATAAFANSPTKILARSRAEITRMFDGFELIEPGVVNIEQWHGESDPPRTKLGSYGGVGRKG